MSMSDGAPHWMGMVMHVCMLWETGLVLACIKCSSDWWMTLWLTGTARRGRKSDGGVITASSLNQLSVSLFSTSFPFCLNFILSHFLCPCICSLCAAAEQPELWVNEKHVNSAKCEPIGDRAVKYIMYFHKLEELQTLLWKLFDLMHKVKIQFAQVNGERRKKVGK